LTLAVDQVRVFFLQHDRDFAYVAADPFNIRQHGDNRVRQAGLCKMHGVPGGEKDLLAEGIGGADLDVGAGGARHAGDEDIR